MKYVSGFIVGLVMVIVFGYSWVLLSISVNDDYSNARLADIIIEDVRDVPGGILHEGTTVHAGSVWEADRTLTREEYCARHTSEFRPVSVVNYLHEQGLPIDFDFRAVLAEERGITPYDGTQAQNDLLMRLLWVEDGERYGCNTPLESSLLWC